MRYSGYAARQRVKYVPFFLFGIGKRAHGRLLKRTVMSAGCGKNEGGKIRNL